MLWVRIPSLAFNSSIIVSAKLPDWKLWKQLVCFMLISIKIQDNLSCEQLCLLLQQAVANYQKTNDISDSVLVIDIKKIIDTTNDTPKLEFKNSPD